MLSKSRSAPKQAWAAKSSKLSGVKKAEGPRHPNAFGAGDELDAGLVGHVARRSRVGPKVGGGLLLEFLDLLAVERFGRHAQPPELILGHGTTTSCSVATPTR